jgi:16S rRNA (adenine1518-N6/adenine1519-N6)-dimethyltransferase
MEAAPVAVKGLFTLQKEMAQRLTASPGHKDYGRLTVAVSLWYEVKTFLQIPAGAFQPKPKVDSSLVYLRLKTEPPKAAFRAAVGRLTQAAFLARRKTILNNLGSHYGKARAEKALEALSVEPSLRPEKLEPQVLAELANLLEGPE